MNKEKDISQYKRILAIGDIHGVYDKLLDLMNKVDFNPKDDLLIFLGDYIDRGPDSLKSLDYVRDLTIRFPEQVIALMGNHEDMCIRFYKEGNKDDTEFDDLDEYMIRAWLRNGGRETLEEFKFLKSEDVSARIQWMKSLPVSYKIGDFYFCHAGIRAFVPLDEQTKFDLLWIRSEFVSWYDGSMGTIVVGHTVTHNLKRHHWPSNQPPEEPVFLKNNIIFCDTGAYKKSGKLSCIDVLTKQFWQAG